MPVKSKQQAKLMFAAKQGNVKGVSKDVGEEFTKNITKKSFKALPKKVKKDAKQK